MEHAEARELLEIAALEPGGFDRSGGGRHGRCGGPCRPRRRLLGVRRGAGAPAPRLGCHPRSRSNGAAGGPAGPDPGLRRRRRAAARLGRAGVRAGPSRPKRRHPNARRVAPGRRLWVASIAAAVLDRDRRHVAVRRPIARFVDRDAGRGRSPPWPRWLRGAIGSTASRTRNTSCSRAPPTAASSAEGTLAFSPGHEGTRRTRAGTPRTGRRDAVPLLGRDRWRPEADRADVLWG